LITPELAALEEAKAGSSRPDLANLAAAALSAESLVTVTDKAPPEAAGAGAMDGTALPPKPASGELDSTVENRPSPSANGPAVNIQVRATTAATVRNAAIPSKIFLFKGSLGPIFGQKRPFDEVEVAV
jgi:hypothetical protein